VRLYLLYRRRLCQSRALHGRALWRASGLGQAANGVGKIVGPLSLALIAGSSNVVSPQATSDAVLPAYLFLAFYMLLVGMSFAFLGVETHGKAMGFGDEDPAAQRGARYRDALSHV
jgi:putative MFS transporter